MARKTPTRTCIACGKAADKRELLRVVRTPEGQVVLDKSGKMPGRGAYLCADTACFERAAKNHLLEARLHTKVTAEEYGRLRDTFSDFVQSSARAHQ